MKKWFHAIGASGKATANVSKLFKQMGWFVTGSDAQFLPPASTIIQDAGIPFDKGYVYKHLTRDFWEDKLGKKLDIPEYPDLGLVMEFLSPKNKELLFARKHDIDVHPYSQLLGEYLVADTSVVVVGTAGKTTTTAAIVHLIDELATTPNYMVGADMVDRAESIFKGDSAISVLEGDEYYNPEISRGAKFLEYKPTHLVITSLGWEHQDVYPTQEAYLESFAKVADLLPQDGVLLAQKDNEHIDKIITGSKAFVVRYGLRGKTEQPIDFATENGIDRIRKANAIDIDTNGIVWIGNDALFKVESQLLGSFNFENILAAIVIAAYTIPTATVDFIQRAVASFHGVKKRLEIIYKSDNTLVIDDFAPTPNRVQNSLATLKAAYPDFEITAIYEPNSASRTSDEQLFNSLYKGTFDGVAKIVIPTLSSFDETLLTEDQLAQKLTAQGYNAVPVASKALVDTLQQTISDKKQLFVFYSSYRLQTTMEQFTDMLQ